MENVLSANQRKLLSFASFANGISWIALIVNTLFVLMRFVNAKNAFAYQHFAETITLVGMFRNDALYTTTLLIDALNQILRGALYWLLLQSASIGLRMIVEMSLNSQDGASNE